MKAEEKIEILKEKLVDNVLNKLNGNRQLIESDIKIIEILLKTKKEPNIGDSLNQLKEFYICQLH